MIKRIFLFLVSLFAGIAIFARIINFVGWEQIENALLIFRGWQGLVILILTLLMMLVGNWKWKEILRGEEIKIPFGSLFGPYLAGFSVMFLAPVLFWAGEIFRAYSLMRKRDISRAKTIASIIIDRILEWTSNLVIIVLGVLFFLYKNGLPPKNLALVFGGIFSVFFSAIFIFYFKTFKKESIAKTFGRIFYSRLNKEPLETEKEIFRFFKLQNKAMFKSFFLSFLRAGAMYLRTLILIFFLNKKFAFLESLSVLGFTYLAAMIPIPTALGSHEAIQTFAFKSLGLAFSTATAFTMIIRTAEFLFALAGLIILFRFGAIILKDIFFEKIEKLSNNISNSHN
jgi:uncharacterized protein (TIRG00374 family)